MELLLSLVTKQEFKEGWKSSYFVQYLSTVTLMSFTWLLFKRLMLPCIMHVYTTLMMLWKFFHYSPRCAVIKGDSDRNRTSWAQDNETIRHTLACTRALWHRTKIQLQLNWSCSWKYIWNITWTRSSWTKAFSSHSNSSNVPTWLHSSSSGKV